VEKRQELVQREAS